VVAATSGQRLATTPNETVLVHVAAPFVTHASAQTIWTRTRLRGNRAHDARRPPTVACGALNHISSREGPPASNLLHDLIGRSPCRGIKLPEVPPLRRTPVTPEAVALLVEVVDVVYQAMVLVGAVLGLRWGEVAGLRVQDLDLLGRTLTVDFQLDEQRELVEVKSGAGRRTLTMPRALVDVLSVHLARAGLTAANGDSLVFTAADGGPLSYTNWRRRTWLPAIEKAGLPDVDFHDLRRAAAIALVRLGVDVKTAQTRLGHSDVRLTLEVYAQATTEGDLEAADRLGERFFALQPAGPARKLHRQK